MVTLIEKKTTVFLIF